MPSQSSTLLPPASAGFVESFNISVAAALIMYEAQQQLQRRLQRPGDLGPQQQQHLMAEFLLRGLVSGWTEGGHTTTH